ncbi:hypothetical protein [Streptosporangium sp. NPDC001681]|uniref:hypothetical protein n=1 Tax=Streptosporangium sp. NPDC001681 TaxID=3154395 RepID=UPI00333339FC
MRAWTIRKTTQSLPPGPRRPREPLPRRDAAHTRRGRATAPALGLALTVLGALGLAAARSRVWHFVLFVVVLSLG